MSLSEQMTTSGIQVKIVVRLLENSELCLNSPTRHQPMQPRRNRSVHSAHGAHRGYHRSVGSSGWFNASIKKEIQKSAIWKDAVMCTDAQVA